MKRNSITVLSFKKAKLEQILVTFPSLPQKNEKIILLLAHTLHDTLDNFYYDHLIFLTGVSPTTLTSFGISLHTVVGSRRLVTLCTNLLWTSSLREEKSWKKE